MTRVLRALQGGLEAMYRIDTDLDIADFLVGVGDGRETREQLLFRERHGEVEIGLFVDERTLENLELRDPARRLDEKNLQDFLLAVEGVSHFVYLAHRASQERQVSAVELELQAEVDKYLVTLLVVWNQTGRPPSQALRNRLFAEVRFAGDLSREERDRYELANTAAASYAESLETRFVNIHAVDDMLAEVRRFWRKGLAGKLAEVSRLAA